jgi:phage terminase small subunit
MRGRKPKPTKAKALAGNPGKRKLNEHEPASNGALEKPVFLKGRAGELWDEYAPELKRLGLLTRLDAHSFSMWCILTAKIEKEGANVSAALISRWMALGSCFGLDPSTRSRIDLHKGRDDEEKDELESFLKGK